MDRPSVTALRRRVGIKRSTQPFGVSWTDDVRALTGPPSVIFDVGANLGQTVAQCVRAFPNATIHAFEPIAETFAQLERNVEALPTVVPVNLALSERAGEATMTYDVTDNHGGKNTLEHAGSANGETRAVVLDTLDAYVERARVRAIDVLKLDVEGHELSVLRGATNTLGSVSFIKSEVDFEDGQTGHTSFDELCAFLRPRGFRVAAFYSQGIGPDGWEWGDVMFVRRGLVPDLRLRSRDSRIPVRYEKPILKHHTVA